METLSLSKAPGNCLVIVERVSDTDSNLLKYLHERGVGIGATVRTQAREPFEDSTTVTLEQEAPDAKSTLPKHRPGASSSTPILLSNTAAESIRVKVIHR